MTNTTCPVTTDGQHKIDWFPVPAQHFDLARGESFTAPAHERGVCYWCDERFTR